MEVPSEIFYSGHQPTGAGDYEADAGNYLSRKKLRTPIFHHSTTGDSVCALSPSEIYRITRRYGHALIAWVVGKDMGRRQLADRLDYHLHFAEDVEVSELGLGFFVLKFCESDYYVALEERPWSIPNLCIHVFPWTPNFKPSEAMIPFVDVWIRLRELSIEYYDDEIFRQIAETIGGALVKIDPVTKERIICKFARICIRVYLCNPLPSMIQLGRIRQKIEYEGLDSLCPICRRVGDLRHDCLNNPSGSSGFDPHQHGARPFQEIGSSLSSSSSSSSSSKQALIPSEPAPASAWGSRFQALENEALIELNDRPSLLMGESETESKSIRTSSPHIPVKAEAVVKQIKKICGVSVQTFPNLPKESSTITIKTPKLKQTHLIQSVPLAPSVVEDQFKAAKTSSPTTLAVHNNQPQPLSFPTIISSLQPCPPLEAGLKFYSTVIQQSTTEKEIINAQSEEISVDSWPTVYTINPTITSLAIDLSDVPTTTRSNQNQYAIKLVPTLRDGNENEIGSGAAVSASASWSRKMLCWNFRGTDNAKLMRALKDLIQLHEPSIVLIFGSKISGADADQVVWELALCGGYCRKPDGHNGGVWVLLSRQDVQTEVSSYSSQQVSASVYFHSKTKKPVLSFLDPDTETSPQPWGQSFFYTSTNWMNCWHTDERR